MKPSRDIERLLEIMVALRDPISGCPWDVEQDFRSIAPYTIEEAYEVADAIDRNDMEDLRLELGDLLLQSVYHAQMANEAGNFDFGDVVEGITEKMIRRHPHVFGDEKARSAGMAKGTWEKIKAEEKKLKPRHNAQDPSTLASTSAPSLLDDIPGNLPPLVVAVKLQQKASKVGFDWNNPSAVLNKVTEEIEELKEELASKHGQKRDIEAELGDILFALTNLARHLDIDPENAVRKTNRKFRSRFNYIEQRARQSGLSIDKMDLETMETFWTEAKEAVKKDS